MNITAPTVAAALSSLAMTTAPAPVHAQQSPQAHYSFVDIRPDMRLRSLVVRPPQPQGQVLLLHGFPETAAVWKDIAETLGRDYEVHAFDWPGYGQSSRPVASERFGYAPRDYAAVLKDYIRTAGLDSSRLVIYATDIGALPALLAALDAPTIAKTLIVGDFAPLNRPEHMHANLQALKGGPAAEPTHAAMNKNRDEILANAYRRGFEPAEQFGLTPEVQQDMAAGWGQGAISSADAFFHYYQHFTADQNAFEARIGEIKTPVHVVWGERDFYIAPQMGAEFAARAGLPFSLLKGLGHYPHLQAPAQAVEEVRAAFAR